MNFPKLTIAIPQSCTQSCNSNLPATSLNAVPSEFVGVSVLKVVAICKDSGRVAAEAFAYFLVIAQREMPDSLLKHRLVYFCLSCSL